MHSDYRPFIYMTADDIYITVKNFIYCVLYNIYKIIDMIDFDKTNLLRQKIASEKPGDSEDSNNRLSFLLVTTAKFLAFYGALWLLLFKLNYTPFNILETIVIYFGIAALWKRK